MSKKKESGLQWKGRRSKEISLMSGAPHPFRFVTFIEVNFSGDWAGGEFSDDGFQNWYLYDDQGQNSGSISITRSDGKVLSFHVTQGFGVHTLNNLIRWIPEIVGSDGPFQ